MPGRWQGNVLDDPVNYIEMYAPVARIELVRTVSAVVAGKGWWVD